MLKLNEWLNKNFIFIREKAIPEFGETNWKNVN